MHILATNVAKATRKSKKKAPNEKKDDLPPGSPKGRHTAITHGLPDCLAMRERGGREFGLRRNNNKDEQSKNKQETSRSSNDGSPFPDPEVGID